MPEQSYAGVYQLENGYWGYRYAIVINGKRREKKKIKNEDGKPFKTQKQAARARSLAIVQAQSSQEPKKKLLRKTIEEVYNEYCENGRSGKAFTTIKKQDSLWKNHLKKKFGKKYIDEITAAEIQDYLSELYYTDGRAYSYVESFLKMFYLIFGQAYSRDYLNADAYSKLCANKDTKIRMPKMKVDEDTDIATYSKEQMQALDEYFKDTNALTAYMLGKYCGLRINECYGLKWENIDIEHGVITIDRQMQYQNGLIKLVSLKTRHARRDVYMSDCLKEYFDNLWKQREEDNKDLEEQRKQNQIMIIDIDGEKISSLELVNILENGKIQTVNSMKFHAKKIKNQIGIHFKYHYLRHTYGTLLATLNTPVHILCNQMGHSNSNVTQKYYIGKSEIGIDILKSNLSKM